MMKLIQKLISVLLVFTLLSALLVSCKKDGGGEEQSTEDTGAQVFSLVSDGKTDISIVYPNEGTTTEKSVAEQLANLISSLTGVKPEIRDDFISKSETYNSETKEILVGYTGYDETAQVLSSIPYGDYAVRVVGNKLVVAGMTDSAVDKAGTQLKTLLRQSVDANKNMTVSADVSLTGTAVASVSALPKYDTQTPPELIDCGDDCMMLLVSKTDKTAFDAYLEQLTAAGFAQKEAHEVLNDDNPYACYTDSRYMVTAIYTTYAKQARIFVEPIANNAYASYVAQTSSKVCEPLLIQVGLTTKEDTIQNGMGYLIRLADGSFLVFDGGMDDSLNDSKTYNRQNAARILELMKQYAPNANDIHIAAWLVTHGHTDHIGAFSYFVKTYIDQVTLERVIINLPSSGQADECAERLSSKMTDYRVMLNTLKQKGVEIYKAHTGQTYSFGGAKLDILYTFEMAAPMALTTFNDSSIVSRVTIEGQTIMLTGDTATLSNGVMIKMYGSDMKCDFLQVPHHGIGANDKNFFSLVAPRWLVWPAGETGYSEVKGKDHLTYFFSSNTSVEQIYVAGFKTTVFSLPFNGTNVTIQENTTIK